MSTMTEPKLDRTSRLKRVLSVSPGRLMAGLAALGLWSAANMALVVTTGDPIVAVAAGVLYTVPLISMWEWMVHGVLYHLGLPGLKGIKRIHAAGHHVSLFPPEKYVQDGRYEFMRFRKPLEPWVMSDNWVDNALTSWSQVALHFVVGVPTIILPAWLLTGSTVFLVSSLVTLAVISWLLAYVHGCIHTPRDRWIEHHRWFQWLDRHHYIHHVDQRSNINFLLPLCDWLFGSLKTELTEREKANNPSFEEAKPMAKDIVPAAASMS